jgi:glycosyltransferase involved in cell wall biosynthesis
MTIKLFYPASYLPHKNHNILASSCIDSLLAELSIRIYLTTDRRDITFSSPNICLLGRLPRSSCIQHLHESSALLFLSSYESLGLPLVEASEAQKPIICLDRPYSRDLLGDSAYYYSDNSSQSLSIAIKKFASESKSPRRAILKQPKLCIDTAWNMLVGAADQPNAKY